MTKEGRGNKFGAVRTWSELCQRTFDSKAEAEHCEALAMLQKAGQITKLEFQKVYVLSEEEGFKVSYRADAAYWEHGKLVVEDVKGKDTEASRIKRAWVKQRYGVVVKLVTKEHHG